MAVEWLGADSAGECLCSVSCYDHDLILQGDSIFKEALDRSVTAPDRSEALPPMGSTCMIQSMMSTSTRSGSIASGSPSTTFLLPIDNPRHFWLPVTFGSSVGSLSCRP